MANTRTHCIRCKSEIEKSYKACPHCGEPVTDFLRRYADEPVDGKYQIVERLGAGGMGEVYKVTHTFLGATRVIKVIRPQISESEDAHERFLREAKAATKVQHPNVATLHDFSALPDGSHYMVWEYIDGVNLAQRIRARGTLSPRYAVQIAIQALHGLEAIHRAGIVHRDISPENLMITRESEGEEERVKIIDMGVAKVEGSTDNATRVGVFVGKLRYASPEHLGFLTEGERIDARADLYSMAMVLYEMLTGRPPFEATSPHEYVMLHSRDTQFKPLNLPPDLPGGVQLQAVLARGLERDRKKRFASAREFANALVEVEKTLPDPSTQRTMNVARPDVDETWRLTPLPEKNTLNRSTVRTGIEDAGPTVRTPLPPFEPSRKEPDGQPSSVRAVAIVVAVIAVAVAAIAYVLWRTPEPELAKNPQATTTTVASVNPTPVQSTANVDVITPAPITTTTQPALTASAQPAAPTATAPTLAQPLTQTTAAVAPPPIRTRPQPPVTQTQPAAPPPREPEPKPAPAPVRSYVEGGDSDANEQLLTELRSQLGGVKTVSVRANPPMLKQISDYLKDEAEVSVSDSADVVIDFNGNIERLGRGKKRRSAQATVSKNGRVIFRYEMPPEEYRIGDTPAEAFAKVLTEALH